MTIKGKTYDYSDTAWVDDDLNYRASDIGTVKTFGTKHKLSTYINNFTIRGGGLRVVGREDRVKFARSFLSITETGSKSRPLLNNAEGITILKNIIFSRGGGIKGGGWWFYDDDDV